MLLEFFDTIQFKFNMAKHLLNHYTIKNYLVIKAIQRIKCELLRNGVIMRQDTNIVCFDKSVVTYIIILVQRKFIILKLIPHFRVRTIF